MKESVICQFYFGNCFQYQLSNYYIANKSVFNYL